MLDNRATYRYYYVEQSERSIRLAGHAENDFLTSYLESVLLDRK